MDVYEVSEKVKFIEWYYGGGSVREIREQFIANFPDRPTPAISTIHRIIKNFQIHGCVSAQSHKKPSKKDEDKREMKEVMVVMKVNEDPTISIKELAKEVGVSRRTAGRMLKKHGYCQLDETETKTVKTEENVVKTEDENTVKTENP